MFKRRDINIFLHAVSGAPETPQDLKVVFRFLLI